MSRDTIPAPAPGAIRAGQAGVALSRALADVSLALSTLESKILEYDARSAQDRVCR